MNMDLGGTDPTVATNIGSWVVSKAVYLRTMHSNPIDYMTICQSDVVLKRDAYHVT